MLPLSCRRRCIVVVVGTRATRPGRTTATTMSTNDERREEGVRKWLGWQNTLWYADALTKPCASKRASMRCDCSSAHPTHTLLRGSGLDQHFKMFIKLYHVYKICMRVRSFGRACCGAAPLRCAAPRPKKVRWCGWFGNCPWSKRKRKRETLCGFGLLLM